MSKLTPDQIKVVLETATKIRMEYPYFRKGQAFFNALYHLHPEIADNIRSTEFDPFYDDNKTKPCINKISSL